MIKTVLNWSSGKDAALACHLLRQDKQYEVSCLLTSVNKEQDRVVMHGVREEMLDAQAQRINLPLKKVYLPAAPDDALYKAAMSSVLNELKEEGITTSAFGDIHLADLKKYREEQLALAGFKGLFPLWEIDTKEIVRMIEQAGIEAVIVCVNEKFLGKEFLGRKINTALLDNLPPGVDPCGEYGEFHTFVYNTPWFSSPIPIIHGELVHKVYTDENIGTAWDKGFWFMDVHI